MGNIIEWRRGKTIDENLILDVESRFNIKFPITYIKIVVENDGGRPYPKYFETDNKDGSMNNLIPFDLNKEFNISWVYENSNFPKGIYPFADDPGGNTICFDYRSNNDNPRIVFFEHELETDDKENFWFISQTFDDFINLFYDE